MVTEVRREGTFGLLQGIFPTQGSNPGGFFIVWATRKEQEHWSGSSIPSLGYLPNPGIKTGSPALQEDSLPAELPGEHPGVLEVWSCVYTKVKSLSCARRISEHQCIYGTPQQKRKSGPLPCLLCTVPAPRCSLHSWAASPARFWTACWMWPSEIQFQRLGGGHTALGSLEEASLLCTGGSLSNPGWVELQILVPASARHQSSSPKEKPVIPNWSGHQSSLPKYLGNSTVLARGHTLHSISWPSCNQSPCSMHGTWLTSVEESKEHTWIYHLEGVTTYMHTKATDWCWVIYWVLATLLHVCSHWFSPYTPILQRENWGFRVTCPGICLMLILILNSF